MFILIEEEGERLEGSNGGREGKIVSQWILRWILRSKQDNSGEALKYTGENILLLLRASPVF